MSETTAKEEEWHGRFFASDVDPEDEGFEPDHVVTVSEVTGVLPVISREERLAMPEEELEDYRLILMEPRKYQKVHTERRISPTGRAVIALILLAVSVAGAFGAVFALCFFTGKPFAFPRILPELIGIGVFIFSSLGFFFTKGKTEKLLCVIFAASAAFLGVILIGNISL